MVATDVLELLKQQLTSGQSLEQSVKELAQADPELAPVVQLISQRETEMRQGLEEEELRAEQDQRDLAQEAERREQVAAVRVQFDELTGVLRRRPGLQLVPGPRPAGLHASRAESVRPARHTRGQVAGSPARSTIRRGGPRQHR